MLVTAFINNPIFFYDMAFILIYVTHKNTKEAKKVVSHLLQKKLIVCANSFHIESSYWWNGKINNSREIVSLLKTKRDNWEKVKSEIKKIHPYETPCIIKMDVEANEDYEAWINSESK